MSKIQILESACPVKPDKMWGLGNGNVVDPHKEGHLVTCVKQAQFMLAVMNHSSLVEDFQYDTLKTVKVTAALLLFIHFFSLFHIK